LNPAGLFSCFGKAAWGAIGAPGKMNREMKGETNPLSQATVPLASALRVSSCFLFYNVGPASERFIVRASEVRGAEVDSMSQDQNAAR
jgi:hypothetical protein